MNCTRIINDTLALLNEALALLLTAKSKDLLDCDTVLTNMLRCMARIVAHKDYNFRVGTQLPFGLLESCETVLRSPRLPEAAREVGRNLRTYMGISYYPIHLDWSAHAR